MKKLLLAGFVFLAVLKFCSSCSDGNNSPDNNVTRVDTSRPPFTDTLGTDSTGIIY